MNDAFIVDSIVKPEASPASRLSVVSISLRSYSLLFVYLPEFGRLVWLTFLLALGAQLIRVFLQYLEVSAVVTDAWNLASHLVILTPFVVSWTQLTVDGPRRIVSKRPFRYGPIEWRYLLADTITNMALLTPIALTAALIWKIRVDQYAGGGSYLALITVGILLAVELLAALSIFLRISFLFPAIALNRYEGISTHWNQTSGYIERLALILGITSLPFVVPVALLTHSQAQEISALAIVPAEVPKLVLLVLMLTVTTGAMALAYKAVVIESAAAARKVSG